MSSTPPSRRDRLPLVAVALRVAIMIGTVVGCVLFRQPQGPASASLLIAFSTVLFTMGSVVLLLVQVWSIRNAVAAAMAGDPPAIVRVLAWLRPRTMLPSGATFIAIILLSGGPLVTDPPPTAERAGVIALALLSLLLDAAGAGWAYRRSVQHVPDRGRQPLSPGSGRSATSAIREVIGTVVVVGVTGFGLLVATIMAEPQSPLQITAAVLAALAPLLAGILAGGLLRSVDRDVPDTVDTAELRRVARISPVVVVAAVAIACVALIALCAPPPDAVVLPLARMGLSSFVVTVTVVLVSDISRMFRSGDVPHPGGPAVPAPR